MTSAVCSGADAAHAAWLDHCQAASPEDVAVYLCSDSAGGISGQALGALGADLPEEDK